MTHLWITSRAREQTYMKHYTMPDPIRAARMNTAELRSSFLSKASLLPAGFTSFRQTWIAPLSVVPSL